MSDAEREATRHIAKVAMLFYHTPRKGGKSQARHVHTYCDITQDQRPASRKICVMGHASLALGITHTPHLYEGPLA